MKARLPGSTAPILLLLLGLAGPLQQIPPVPFLPGTISFGSQVVDKRQAATPTATSTPGWFPTTPTATVAVATAREDGAIIHIVQPGETLWTIALAYGVTEADIQRFNNLGQYIYPGDKLFIRPAYTPTPTQPTPTQTARPSSTPWPTSTPTPTRTPLPATPIPAAGLSPVGGAAIVAIIVLAALGLAALAARAGRRPHRSG